IKIAMDNANARLAKERNGADIPNVELFINNLGLRETVNKAASAHQDGSWGLGSTGLILKNTDLLSANGVGNAFFVQGGGTDNHFGSYGAGVHLSYGSGGGNTLRLSANLFVDPNGNLSVEWLGINRSDGSVRTQKLQKLYGPLNKPTARDVGAIPFFGEIATGTNLNTLIDYGIWFNPANANATPELNYPSWQAGSLLILRDAGCTQIYTEYASRRQFRRGLYSGTWSPWCVVYDSGNKPTPDDVNAIAQDGCRVAGFVNGNQDDPYMRHTASNTVVRLMTSGIAYSKFVQGVQLGAEARMWSNAFTSEGVARVAKIPAGCTMTLVGDANASGNSYLNDIDFVGYKPIQRNINGTWVTISG
ncbi:MAG: pyocin knob domain-containing protein, partial [Hafnia sp.]